MYWLLLLEISGGGCWWREIITGPAGRVHIGERFMSHALGGILEIDEAMAARGVLKLKITTRLHWMRQKSWQFAQDGAVEQVLWGRCRSNLWGPRRHQAHGCDGSILCPTEISASVSKLASWKVPRQRGFWAAERSGWPWKPQHLWLHKMPSSRRFRLQSAAWVACKDRNNDSPMLEALPFLGGMYSLRVLNVVVRSCRDSRAVSLFDCTILFFLGIRSTPCERCRRSRRSMRKAIDWRNRAFRFESSLNLRVLRLSRNKPSGYPDGGRAATAASCTSTIICWSDPEISALQHLAYLKLERNCIKRIPLEAFAELTLLERFDLAGNPLTTWCLRRLKTAAGASCWNSTPRAGALDNTEENICRGAGARKLAEEA